MCTYYVTCFDYPLHDALVVYPIITVMTATVMTFMVRLMAPSPPYSYASHLWPSLLPQGYGDDSSRQEGQHPHGAYGPGDPQRVSDDPSGERAHGVAEVPPEAVDAQGTCPPGRM